MTYSMEDLNVVSVTAHTIIVKCDDHVYLAGNTFQRFLLLAVLYDIVCNELRGPLDVHSVL